MKDRDVLGQAGKMFRVSPSRSRNAHSKNFSLVKGILMWLLWTVESKKGSVSLTALMYHFAYKNNGDRIGVIWEICPNGFPIGHDSCLIII